MIVEERNMALVRKMVEGLVAADELADEEVLVVDMVTEECAEIVVEEGDIEVVVELAGIEGLGCIVAVEGVVGVVVVELGVDTSAVVATNKSEQEQGQEQGQAGVVDKLAVADTRIEPEVAERTVGAGTAMELEVGVLLVREQKALSREASMVLEEYSMMAEEECSLELVVGSFVEEPSYEEVELAVEVVANAEEVA